MLNADAAVDVPSILKGDNLARILFKIVYSTFSIFNP